MKKKYPEKAIEYIDAHFPKGDKRRGEVLVVNAIAFMEGKEIGKEGEKGKWMIYKYFLVV